MSHGADVCLDCGMPIDEFTDTSGFMVCPNSSLAYDVITGLMPKFNDSGKHLEAIDILKKGGYKMSSGCYDGEVWTPIIPIIKELAERLMKYEVVNGARHHDSRYVCKACVKRQSHCITCNHEHKPKCRICGTELVPMG